MSNGDPAGGITVKERLDRIETSIDGLTTAVASVRIMASNTATRLATAGAILAILISTGGGLYTYINVQARHHNQIELCSYIDTEHNRLRHDIIRNEALLYEVPSFKVLISTPQAERAAYDSARTRYESIRATRPDFCENLSNPVLPFPPLQDFQRGVTT